MLQMRDIKKFYFGQAVIDGVNIELPDTGLVLLTGNNGSGKTTLLNILGGLDTPDEGEILFDGRVLSKEEKDLRDNREKNVSFIFQNNNLFNEMTVRDNIDIVGEDVDTKEYVDKLGLYALLDKKVKLLSGGEKARVAIARAIAKNSKIILADEPTASIDAESKTVVLNILRELSKDRLVVLVSHQPLDAEYADIVINLVDGKINDAKNKIAKRNNCEKKYVCKQPQKNMNFDATKFARKNLNIKTKQSKRNDVLLLISLFLLLLSLSISSLKIEDMTFSTMKKESMNSIVIKLYNPPEKDLLDFISSSFADYKIDYGTTVEVSKVYDGYEQYTSLSFDIPSKKKANYLYFYSCKDLQPTFGRTPTSGNEIVVTSYLADSIIENGVKSIDGYYSPASYEQLLEENKRIALEDKYVNIVGIKDIEFKRVDELKRKNTRQSNALLTEVAELEGSSVWVYEDFYEVYQSSWGKPTQKNISRVKVTAEDSNKLKHLLDKFPLNYEGRDYYAESIFTYTYNKLDSEYDDTIVLMTIGAWALTILAVVYLVNYILNLIDIHTKDIAVLKSLGVEDSKIITSFVHTSITKTARVFIYSVFAFLLVSLVISFTATSVFAFDIILAPVRIWHIAFVLLGLFVIQMVLAFIIYKKIHKMTPKKLSMFLTDNHKTN